MIRSYLTFTRANVPLLAYGIILMILSSPGQTFFLSLFSEDFCSAFSLSLGDLGTIFAAATFASALALPFLGERIDRMALGPFTLGIGLLLCLACILLGAASASALVFGLCLFLLRLGGQGLMVHTAMTATVRAFPADSGKAIAVVSLLYSAALVFVPAIAASAAGLLGWRLTWVLTGGIVLAGAVAACRVQPSRAGVTDGADAEKADRQPTAGDTAARPSLRLMLLACPVMLAFSFIFTGLLFHQAVLAGEKGWSLEWLAGCFSAFAIAQSAGSVLAGPAIDRLRAVQVLPFFLLPLAGALLLAASAGGFWVAPVYMALLGLSAAIDLKLGTILWSDLYGAAKLGYVRSRFEAIRIVVTGAAPLVTGKLIDLGIPLTQQAIGFAAYVLCICALAVPFGRLAARGRRPDHPPLRQM